MQYRTINLIIALLSAIAMVSCNRDIPTSVLNESTGAENLVLTPDLLQAEEIFWENRFDLPALIDSVSWKESPIKGNQTTIRWRKLKTEHFGREFYEVGYYEPDGRLNRVVFMEYEPQNQSARNVSVQHLLDNISPAILSLFEFSSTCTQEHKKHKHLENENIPAQILSRSKSSQSQIVPNNPMEVMAQKLSKTAAPTESECSWDWGMTDPMHIGWYFEDADFQGGELNWIHGSVSWSPARWGVSIANLHQSPWWFNDIISSLDQEMQHTSIYCAEEDILKRRFMWTDVIMVWKHANFGNPTMQFDAWLNDFDPPFFIIVTPPSCNGDLSYCDWDIFDPANDDISSLRVYITIHENTY